MARCRGCRPSFYFAIRYGFHHFQPVCIFSEPAPENDCNLSVSSYVEQEDTREVINITEVNSKLASLVSEGNELNQKIEAIIKELGEYNLSK